MAQEIESNIALCPFYGSSNGCPYLDKCTLSHANPNSIELCPSYQTLKGCSNPICYYRHSLIPLTKDQEQRLAKTYKIAGQIHYSRVIKGNAVHRAIIVINEEKSCGIHLIIEDGRMQKLHYQKYCFVYCQSDAILISEIIGSIILKSDCPGKFLSYLKNLIDGRSRSDQEKNMEQTSLHYRDVLNKIGNDFNQIPKPENPRLVSEYNRVPWIDFILHPLPLDVYDHPDIFLQPGDLVRAWRKKKLVYHCGIYLGNKQIIHISNGIKGDQGLEWNFSSLFQSGSAAPPRKKSDDSEQKVNDNNECKQMAGSKESELLHDDLNAVDKEFERRARKCDWSEFLCGSRKKDLELGYFVFPWRKPSEIVYTAQFLTEIHYMKGHYSIMKNNCEHFALYCCTGLRHSPQASKVENIINVASKIGSIASSIFSKAASSIALIKSKKNNVSAEDDESENHKNHPIINSVELDDGGDDELENILLCDNNAKENKEKQKQKNPIIKKKEKDNAVIVDLIEDKVKENKNIVQIDEYAEDEEDVLFEDNMDELKMEDINNFDMTPGGLSQSEIFNVKNANDKNSWNV